MENLAGHSIKGYDLQERIGTGGFGAVYRAYQSTIGREVAVKIILPGFANHPDFIRRFESEAQIVARLEHPYITPLFDYWRDPDGAYLVMRWLRGGSLRDVLRKQPFDAEGAALLLDQITAALSVAHRNNVIHRDLKPGNILLDEDGNAYLADFGIAKDIGTSSNTEIDAIVGSPDYLSPEQARSEPVTPQTDVYSLGVVLYEMLTGEHPFPGLSAIERLYKHLSDPLPPITALPDSTRDSINEVIQKATAKNPVHRYADAPAMAAAFRAAIRLQQGQNVVETLTQREQEILQRVIAGQSNRQIAADLVVTVGTVKWYITQIYRKLNVRSRVQAIVRARELNLIVNESTPGAAVSLTAIPTDDFNPENPYKGLRAFQAADCRDFFGREKLVDKLLKRMGEVGDMTRFMAVVGPSGSGKSSLVRAGLIPALWRGELRGSERWFVAEMIPGTHPLDELEIALTKIAGNQSINLREHLERDARGLVRASQLILPEDGSELVLVIDQFEEVFTLLENEEARIHFLDLLYAAATEPRSRLRVIVTLRADFYDRPLHYPQFGELVRSRLETLLPLSADGLERAITRPAEQVGVMFEPGLVAAIIGDVNYQPGVLPLLQYALTELFESRSGRSLTHEAYQAIGGTVGALAKRAEEVYEGLDEAGRELVRQLFLRLVTLGEGVEDTRRRTARSELTAITDDADLMDEVIDTFAAYRLLSLDTDPGTRTPTVEVAHEALLREWERLRVWLNDSRDEIKLQRQLAAMAEEWKMAKQDTSFLASGSRLEQFEVWAAQTGLALTARERGYLDASIAERERQTALEMVRQAQVKTLERRSQTFLRGLVAVFAGAAVIALCLMGVALNQSALANTAMVEAKTERDNARSLALINGSQAALNAGFPEQAIALALQADGAPSLSNLFQVTLGEAAYTPGAMRVLTGHTDEVHSAAFSPDGRLMVTASLDKTLILWDVATGNMLRQLVGHTLDIESAAFSPDSRMVVSGGLDKTLILWDVATGDIIRRFDGNRSTVFSIAFSPDGLMILSGSQDRRLSLWDVTTGTLIRTFDPQRGAVNSVAFSPDGQTAIAGSGNWDGRPDLVLLDVATGETLRQFVGHTEAVQGVAFSPDGRTFISGSGGQLGSPEVILWDVATGQEIRRFNGHQLQIWSVAFSPDGKTVLSGSQDNTMMLWDVNTGELLHRFRGHNGLVHSVAFSPDAHTAISGSADSTARVWDLNGGALAQEYGGHQSWVWDIALSQDASLVAASARDGSVRVWNTATGEVRHELEKLPGENRGMAFATDGRSLFVNYGSNIRQLDIATGSLIHNFTGHSGGITDITMSPDGQTLLSASDDSSIILWDIQTRTKIRHIVGHKGNVTSVRFNGDGTHAISASADGTVIMWDVGTGKMLQQMKGHHGWVWSVGFSPDEHMALSGGDDALILWNLDTGAEIRRFKGHSGPVSGVVFMPDGQHAVSSSADKSVIVWDIATGEILRRFDGPELAVKLILAADGRTAFVPYADGHVLAWRIDSQQDLIAWTRANRYIPELTCEQRDLYQLEPLCPLAESE